MLVVTILEGGVIMLTRRDEHREHGNETHSKSKSRDEARFKAALKVIKHSPGHKDRPHSAHDNKH
jgi:hypothetical protein